MTALAFLMTRCVPNDGTFYIGELSYKLAGFWSGLWHGTISGITLLLSLFNKDIGIYEIINNGTWYNFGFLIGVGGLAGGSVQSSNKRID